MWAGQEQSAVALQLAACVDSSGLAGESLSAGASGSLVADRVLGTGMGDLSCVGPGPADSAVAAGSDVSAVCPELGPLVLKVGSALVSGSPELTNQIQLIQAYDEKKVRNGSFAAAAADSVPAAVSVPAPAPAPVILFHISGSCWFSPCLHNRREG